MTRARRAAGGDKFHVIQNRSRSRNPEPQTSHFERHTSNAPLRNSALTAPERKQQRISDSYRCPKRSGQAGHCISRYSVSEPAARSQMTGRGSIRSRPVICMGTPIQLTGESGWSIWTSDLQTPQPSMVHWVHWLRRNSIDPGTGVEFTQGLYSFRNAR